METTKAKIWQKTNTQNLLRHVSGKYYARVSNGRKQVWKSLKTSHLSVAKPRLAKFIQERAGTVAPDTGSAKMTFAEALELHMAALVAKVKTRENKPGTLHYWKQIYAALDRSWPELAGSEIRRVTASDCRKWAMGFSKASSTRFNNTVAGLRHVFEIAIESGIIYANPASKVSRQKVRNEAPTLPSRDEFTALVDGVAKAGAWCSRDCADFIQGLAFTGCRKGEASEMEWRDLDFEAEKIIVRGDPITATKNGEIRRVPMIPAARTLFERMRADRQEEAKTEKVFRVNEAQKAIDHACKKLGITRITHHDLRHLFATICIESGVDIPTVSRWLGHKDGGVLAMKTYGHLRDEHSTQQAARVNF